MKSFLNKKRDQKEGETGKVEKHSSGKDLIRALKKHFGPTEDINHELC